MAGNVAASKLLQTKVPCRNCGKAFTFQEGSRLVLTSGVVEVVVVCPACHSIFRIRATPDSLTLLGDVTQEYAQKITPRPANAAARPTSANEPMGAAQSSFAAPPGMVGSSPRLEPFPVAASVLLHFITLGLFSFFHLNLLHGKLPKVRPDDPSAGKAIGFMFIPFFNFYWVFFSYNRLCLRVDEQTSATRAAAQQSSRPFHCDVRNDDHPVRFLLRLLANPGSDLFGHDALQRQRAGGRRRLFMAGNAPCGWNGSNHAAASRRLRQRNALHGRV